MADTIRIEEIYVSGNIVWLDRERQPAWLELGTWKNEQRIRNNIRVTGYAQAIGGGDLGVKVKISGNCGSGTAIADISGMIPEITDYTYGVTPGEWYHFDINVDTYVKFSNPESLLKVTGNISDGSVTLSDDCYWSTRLVPNMWIVPRYSTSEWVKFASGYAGGFVRIKNPASDNWIYVRSLVNGVEVDKQKVYYGMDHDILLKANGFFELQICERATSGSYLGFTDIQIIEENVITGLLNVTAENNHSFEKAGASVSTRGYFDDWFGGAKWLSPAINITGISVYKDNTPVTEWYSNEEVYIHVGLDNSGDNGTASVEIYYDSIVIDTFSTTVYSGVPQTVIRGPFTIPSGSWNICARITEQIPG